MGFLDTTDAEMIALTRQRRREAAARREAYRAAHEVLSFPAVLRSTQDQIEAAWRTLEPVRYNPPHVVWKNEQWVLGVRNCGYCTIRMTRTPNVPRTCTVDHRKARAFGGTDEPRNWIMSCLDCNTRKGTMSEAQFRQHLAIWKELDARLTG